TIVTFPFDFTDPNVTVRVIDPSTREVIYETPLYRVIDPSTIPDDPFERVIIHLDIQFIGADVTVTVRPWGTQPVQPV
ncbi:MAG: hypothetical protein LBF09_00595, partial [Odoribacteraceae bacterium]|nr:hypothetical protein [Odoribacteraceae bacterium]